MKLEDAIIERIEELKKLNNFTRYELSERSGVPQTTLISIKRKRSKNVGVATIQKICETCGITLNEFFDVNYFKSLDSEDK